MDIALSITYHDPQGNLVPLIQRHLPTLQQMFSHLAVRGSRQANDAALSLFESLGAVVAVDSSPDLNQGPQIGRARREAVALALEFDTPFSMHCDGDRILHWVENYPTYHDQYELLASPPPVGKRTELPFHAPHFVQQILDEFPQGKKVSTTLDLTYQKMLESRIVDYVEKKAKERKE